MAQDDAQPLSTDQRVRRSVARTLGNLTLGTVLVAAIGVWLSLGVYTLGPGQAAILLLLGRHMETVVGDGFHITLPPPLVAREIVHVGMVRNEDFGFTTHATPGEGGAAEREASVHESTMQTSDNNTVRVSFSVQYRIRDAYMARFRIADPSAVVRAAAAAAMREVVGRMTVDGVWREQKDVLTSEASSLLQTILDAYDAGLEIRSIALRDVQPPDAVRAAFDDVVAATQDASRLVNEAEGYRNQRIPSARAEAIELTESANGYRDAKIAEAAGEAARFVALAAEYRKAPAVTRKRLYLETMESVLPGVEKVIVKPGQVVPYLPLERRPGPAK
ncbi:MAG TPA: FtsH protease activity modulator HflK [Myxococcota bacterium]|nr:FtsH protease activity modulator HflK [Myxococcota bacterium]